MKMTDDPKLAEFYRWLHSTGRTQVDLANDAGASRPHLSLVLNGSRRGRFTWRRLVRVLPEPGLLLLQQCSAWNKDAKQALDERREAEACSATLQKFAKGKAAA